MVDAVSGTSELGATSRREEAWKKMEKIAWVFSSFCIAIQVGTSELGATSRKKDTLACHISEKGNCE
jgi:hypothetical protein